jgi:AAA+ ATPase superfamily predicted ATPase
MIIKLLDFYKEDESDFFFGRTEEIKKLLTLINEYSLVVLCGESGTGKTSIIKAGIIPEISRRQKYYYHRMNELSRTELFALLDLNGYKSDFFSAVLKSSNEQSEKNILILDQFEEYLINYRENSDWLGPDKLKEINKENLTIVFSFRNDFLPAFMQ